MVFKQIIFICSLFFSTASYSRTVNQDLKEQFEEQHYRKLPQSDWYSLGVDTFLFKPYDNSINGQRTWYHGNGYWLNFFSEFRVGNQLDLNLKLSAYNPSSSYGYTAGSGFNNVAGVTWTPPTTSELKVWLRFFDLDRQTFGSGLLIEDKELSGFKANIQFWDLFQFNGTLSGAGGFFTPGDLYDVELSTIDRVIGFHTTFYTGKESPSEFIYDPYGNIIYVSLPKPFYGLFINTNINPYWHIGAEINYNKNDWAGLISTKYTATAFARLKYSYSYQYRYYGNHYADELIGVVQQGYVSPEHYDKNYVSFHDIYLKDNNVQVHSGNINLTWSLNSHWELYSENEIGVFDFKNYPVENFYYYRHGVKLYPYINEPHFASILYSSKSLNSYEEASNYTLPNHTNTPLFTEVPHIAFEAYIFF